MSAVSPPDFIDVHYHVNPDAYVRRHSAIQAGSVYAKHNGWVILKIILAAPLRKPGKLANKDFRYSDLWCSTR